MDGKVAFCIVFDAYTPREVLGWKDWQASLRETMALETTRKFCERQGFSPEEVEKAVFWYLQEYHGHLVKNGEMR